jgi:hypothetical protein
MSTNSISEITLDGKGRAGNVALTHVKAMDSKTFWSRIAAANGTVQVEELPGMVNVYRNDQRIARWLPEANPPPLHHLPLDTGVTTDAAGNVQITPPTCPTCSLHNMELYRKDDDHSFFWGCPGKWGPRRCEGTINVVARSIDELIALADYLVRTHSEQVEEGRRRRRSRIFDYSEMTQGVTG